MSVTTYLMGGCGNQMFQYAAGLALARRLGTSLRFDISRYDNPNEFRVYSLGLFKGITAEAGRGMRGTVIREQGLPYNPGLFDRAPKECTIYGYWQTEKYFSEIRTKLLDDFWPARSLTPMHLEVEKKIREVGNRSVFLTVRRTDYVGNSFHGLLPKEYYEEAARIIADHVLNPVFFVFSDEPEWCASNFQLSPHQVIISGNFDRTIKGHLGREDAELWLMRSCKHAVMANSSYSWWGAWLNPDPGLIIAPKNWFGTTSTEDPRDIIPERWLRI